MTSVSATASAAPWAECRATSDQTEREWHHAIRYQVFVGEQAVFVGTDVDAADSDPRTVHVLAWLEGQPVGAVRLYPLDEAGLLWQGDRLAVLPEARAASVGADLVKCAVATAGAAGGSAMVAHIQLPNVRFFTYLGWEKDGEIEIYAGLPHQPMRITF